MKHTISSENFLPLPGLFGVVVCGGRSSRMGQDKCLLEYHGKPQCVHLYDMLELFCGKVFISCNSMQVNTIPNGYPILADLPIYNDIGPMAALLTAFKEFPEKDMLIIGCDYPFLSSRDIQTFIQPLEEQALAKAFYNEEAGLFEPLLAYYSHQCAPALLQMYTNEPISLQHFLDQHNAKKFFPANVKSIKSVDTEGDYLKAKILINNG